MATWLVGHSFWLLPVRARLLNRLDVPPSRLWPHARSHLNIALKAPSPSSLEIETMPYPTAHPDAAVFEPMSEEYTSVSMHDPHHFTPLSSSDTLASLVSNGNFHAADALRKEMISHHIPIPRDVLYLRAALHAITQRSTKGSAKERLDTFEAWLSLAPDRHEEWQSFHDIRQRLFRVMDHLNLTLVYHFGLVLASKGYHAGNAAMQVVATLARFAQPSIVERYLSDVEDAARRYYLKTGTDPPSDLLASAYNLAIRTVALGGKDKAALGLISQTQSHGILVSDFTLNIVTKHAPDRQTVIDSIRATYPSWTPQDSDVHSTRVEHEPIAVGQTTDVVELAARLRALRNALRSPYPPSPHALHSFMISYWSLRRTRAIPLLRALACRHSPKSASVWAFTEMLHHRSRRKPIHLLFVFAQHFHPVGVPRKTLLSLIRGPRGQQAQKEHLRWVVGTRPINEKLWPSAYHTALVWEAIVLLSPSSERERLYALLLSLVRRSRQLEQERMPVWDALGADPRVRVELPPDTYDAAHFSPFVSWWARRHPARAASVLRDMVNLGVEPSVVQWGMIARGYAQHDDPGVALHILNHAEEMELGKEGERDGDTGKPSDALVGIHTNVLRGFVIAGDVTHAREAETRLMERFGYRIGDRPATDASIALLRELEERHGLT